MDYRGAVALLVLLAVGCDFSSTNPTGERGSISGTIRYVGPPPTCAGDRLVGELYLRLEPFGGADVLGIENDDVPVARVLGTRLFDVPADCGSPTDPPITRETSYAFEDAGPSASEVDKRFRVTAIWDDDGDFAEEEGREMPTRGDIRGGAYVDPAASPRIYRAIQFESPAAHPDGEVIDNVDLTVDEAVFSEIPLFRIGAGTMPLSAEAVIPAEDDAATREQMMYELTNLTLELPPTNTEPYASGLAELGIDIDESARARGFWVQSLDRNGDGAQDAHPLLGSAGFLGSSGVPWFAPLVVFKRARTAEERAMGVPDVLIIPTVRPAAALSSKEVFAPSIEMLVVPSALMVLDPERPLCRVPVLAPGNTADYYERVPVECQEIPTGRYDAILHQGVAGGTLNSGVSPDISDTGFRVAGGAFVDQTWSIPNRLSDFANDQGENGRFDVIDPDETNSPDVISTDDGHGVEACTMAPDPAMDDMVRQVRYMTIPNVCCESIRDLCGLPLCEPRPLEGGFVRQRGPGDPECLPFLMPSSCCR